MKNIAKITTLLLLAIACTGQNDPVIQTPNDASAIKLTVNQQKRVNQDNEFAIDLLRKTISSTDETNVFVSPLSVSIALGLAWNGAFGTTKTEMETALKMSGMSVEDINSYYKIMQTTLPGIDPNTKLSIANSLWYRTGFEVKPSYLKVNTDYFNAYVKEMDFSKTWAVDTINNWCARNTNNLIPTIIDNIPDAAVMYLTNAVYFKGIWRKKFDKNLTTENFFTNEKFVENKVNMMSQKDTFAYAFDNNAQYVDLPYGNNAFSMTVILPVQGKTTSDILNSLTSDNWSTILSSLNKQQIMLYMPRFKVENKFQLKNPLIEMGMKKAFTDFADFSGIANAGLMISEVVHKTYVTVDEDGTEAAAVTNIGFVTTSMPNYPIVTVNHPFIFVIREKSTGVILFVGKMGTIDKY